MSIAGDQWVCTKCGIYNLTVRNFCRGCGAVRTGTEEEVGALEAIREIISLSPEELRTQEIASAYKSN